MLQRIGLDAHGLMGRVRWGLAGRQPDHRQLHDDPTSRCPTVPISSMRWLGGMTPTGLLRFVPDIVQATPHEPFRLLREGPRKAATGCCRLKPLVAGATSSRFDLNPQIPIDLQGQPPIRRQQRRIVLPAGRDCGTARRRQAHGARQWQLHDLSDGPGAATASRARRRCCRLRRARTRVRHSPFFYIARGADRLYRREANSGRLALSRASA